MGHLLDRPRSQFANNYDRNYTASTGGMSGELPDKRQPLRHVTKILHRHWRGGRLGLLLVLEYGVLSLSLFFVNLKITPLLCVRWTGPVTQI